MMNSHYEIDDPEKEIAISILHLAWTQIVQELAFRKEDPEFWRDLTVFDIVKSNCDRANFEILKMFKQQQLKVLERRKIKKSFSIVSGEIYGDTNGLEPGD